MTERSLIDILWILISASLVFLMQAGFLCLEAGATRSKHNINVVIKNITDLGVSVLCFWLFGYGLMFGATASGWLGMAPLAPEVGQDVWTASFFLFQAMFCSTAVTIVSGAVAERIRFSAYLGVTLLVSGLLYPIFGHWAWNGLDAGTTAGWLGRLGFVDFAGSTVVHSVGGWVALAAVLIIGPRVGRFSPKRRRLIVGYDLPMASLGTLLLWLGWFGFNGGSVLALTDAVPGIIVNTLLAGAAGLVFPMIFDLLRQRRVSVQAVMNGALAGLVAITANCHAVSAGAAILIGSIGSLCMVLTAQLLERHRIDDVVGAIPVHLSAGIWGTVAVGIFGDRALLGTGLSRVAQVAVQLLGVSVAAVWTFGMALLTLSLINRRWSLRVTRRQEHIGLNVAEHGATSDLVDLFMVMRRQERTGDLGLRAPVEEFTPVGQIAARYNRVMGRLEQAIARTDAIVATASEAILTIDPADLKVQSANPAVRKLFGISEERLCQQTLASLVDMEAAEEGPTLHEVLWQASNDGYPYELVGIRQGGTTFPVELLASKIKTRGHWSYAVILRDITLRKQAKEAIQTSEAKDLKAKQLEKALKDLQQTQLQLVHTEKMSSLGQLVAGVTHEINNPINFIYGNLHHLKDYASTLIKAARQRALAIAPLATAQINGGASTMAEVDDAELDYITDDMPKLLTSMEIGAERISEIVRALQDFSHRGDVQLKQVDIHQGLESTLTILGSRLKARHQCPEILITRCYAQLPPIECYPSLLNQVFMNLFANAIDAVEERAGNELGAGDEVSDSGFQPEITISTYWTGNDLSAEPEKLPRTELGDQRVCVVIMDNGVGIPEAVKQRMLDPFFTTKPVGKGTGLGMAISHRIVVDHHQGQLSCVSAVGEGTRFVIELPVIQEAAKLPIPLL